MNNRLLTVHSQSVIFRRAKAIVLTSFLFAGICLIPFLKAHSQDSNSPVTVTGIAANGSPKKTTVSILGDQSLKGAQTWQDSEGFHVVVPNASIEESVKVVKGVKVRRIGQSIEIVAQVKPGVPVSVERTDNRVALYIEGKLEPRSIDPDTTSSDWQSAQVQNESTYSPPVFSTSQSLNASSLPYQPSATPAPTEHTESPDGSKKGFVSSSTNPNDAALAASLDQNSGDSVRLVQEEDSFLATVFSGTSVLVVFALGLIGLLVTRKLNSRTVSQPVGNEDQHLALVPDQFPEVGDSQPGEPTSTSLVRNNGGRPKNARKSVVRLPVSMPASLFGAYRIDQEVSKLISGQAHRMDVLASRAPDDRRAIETSLAKVLSSHEYSEAERSRAVEALEEYGFVARECAALLTAPDAFERTSAARSLGEIKSPAALPFLLEGLYDHESIVRNQAVISIGELKIPAAIGALLDMARRHPDVPSSLVSRALSACSVEGLDFFDVDIPEPTMLSAGHPTAHFDEIARLEPASSVEDLPESTADENLVKALSDSESEDSERRAQAVKELAQYEVQTSVSALSRIARSDVESSVRALAVSSLASINHESVFSAILIAMADESREVRAAAARSLSRLCFDRADAYARVMETADEQLLADVGAACLRSGLVSQNIDRLPSSDRRQTYEAFALICLLAKARMTDLLFDAIRSHENHDVRLMIIHCLANTGEPEIFEQFQQVTLNDPLPEDVKTALLDAMYKLEQAKPSDTEQVNEVQWVDSDSYCEPQTSDHEEVAPPEPIAISTSQGEIIFDDRDY